MKMMMFSAAAAAALSGLLSVSAPASAKTYGDPSAAQCEWQTRVGPRAPAPVLVCNKIARHSEETKGMGGPLCRPEDMGRDGQYVYRFPSNMGPRVSPALERVRIEGC